MRRDQRRSVFVPDKTEDTEANGSIISSEVVSLNEPLWLMPFISSMPKQSHSTFSVSTIVNEFRWGRKVDTWAGMQPTDLNCCEGGVFDTSKLTPLAKEAFAAFPQIDGQRFAILQS